MWNEFKRSMWTDNPFAKDRLELGFNLYEVQHCCFDGDDSDSSNGGGGLTAADFEDYEGVGGKGSHAQAEADAAAQAAADAAATAQQEAIDEGLGLGAAAQADQAAAQAAAAQAVAEAAGRSASGITDYENVEGIGQERDAEGNISRDEQGKQVTTTDLGLGYNDLVDLGYFEAREQEMKASDRKQALDIQEKARKEGKDVTVTVDPITGDYQYTGKDAGTVGMGQIGKGVEGLVGGLWDQAKGLYGASQLGPAGFAMSALTGTGPWADYGRGRGPFGKDAPFYDERLDRASLNLTPSGIPSIEARKEHLDARANLGMGDFYREGRADKKTEDKFKADYDAQAIAEAQAAAKARDEQFQREREEEELGFLTPERIQGFKRGGLISLQEGGQMEEILYPPEDEPPVIVPEEPEVTYPPEDEPPVVTPEPGFEPTGSAMKDYFLSRKETPVREPNKYLVELFRNISGGEEDIKDTWRRLGWTPKEERTFITPPTPKPEPVRHWKNREINDYTGLTKEQQKMKYEDDLQHANPEYGDEGTGYEASSVIPPWEWSYYNEQATV